MTTPRQFASNGRNAQKSTGPRTAAGRQRSSRNSLRHGIRSDKYLLPGEEEEFQLLLEALREHWKPATALEERRVFKIATYEIRLDRGARGEAEVIADTPLDSFFRGEQSALKNLLHYETVNRKGLRFETELLERMQAQRSARANEAGVHKEEGEANPRKTKAAQAALLPEENNSLDREKAGNGLCRDERIVQTNPIRGCLVETKA